VTIEIFLVLYWTNYILGKQVKIYLLGIFRFL